MLKQQESLQGHISDMKGATDHLAEAFARQAEDAEVKKDSKVANLIGRLHQMANSQSLALKLEMERFGTEAKDPIKHAVAALTGAMAGIYGKLRPNPVSRMLRDDYTALSLAMVSNSMLHVTALAAEDERTAKLAETNMEAIAPLIIELGEAVLPVVERELSAEFAAKPGAAEASLQVVRKIWN